MHQVLLCKRYQEVRVQVDVEGQVARVDLGVGDVQIEGLVEVSDSLVLVHPSSPLDLSLQEGLLCSFA